MIERSTNARPSVARDAGTGTIVTQVIFRTLGLVMVMAAILMAFAILAARNADGLAMQRQQHLISTVLGQNFRMVAHDQEASTVWDESVRKVHARPLDLAWLDANLGIWLHTYYGHDEAYVIDDEDRPIYAMRGGRRDDPSLYDRSVGSHALALIAELRAMMRHATPVRRDGRTLTPGTTDLAVVGGHPAIISVKPIVSDSGAAPRPAGRDYLHISIRYIDGGFAQDLAQRYELTDAHFATSLPDNAGQHSVALRTRSGDMLGYFVWSPFRPGSGMFYRLLPVLATALLLMLVLVVLLLRRISRNTVQLSDAKIRAQHLAHHDPLTGLANRALFDRRLQAELAQLTRSDRSLALLYIDLDHFKNVNDNLGHPAGDALICAVARLLQQYAGTSDTVARLGGDEFAIIRVTPDAAASAEALSRTLGAAFREPLPLHQGEVVIGASIGVATAPADAIDAIELVRKADIALYDAKASGRHRHSFFRAEMGERIRQRHDIGRDLREALQQVDGLDIRYQPFFDVRTGRIDGVEALVRWTHPTRGVMRPAIFIPIAEESGLIEILGEWVLEQACDAAASWPTITMSVNLSAVQLRNPTVVERIFAILRRTRLDPGRLELEITETSFLESNEACRRNVERLRDIGVNIALDDFGTGYSSFKHLCSFDVDRVKIDQSFVSGIDITMGGSPVVQAIVDLARASGIKTTAEGVETLDQLTFLAGIGCGDVQGYLLSEPLPAAQVTQMLLRPARPLSTREHL